MVEYVRLHISPFSEETLLPVLGSSLLPLARKLSFHRISTFPERTYGFVDLPKMEATKLRKRLNGSILKGKKVHVEDAREDSRRIETEPTEEEAIAMDNASSKRLRKSERKRGRGDTTLDGYEMPENRRVKRGWTEPASGSKKRGSKKGNSSSIDNTTQKASKPSTFTDGPECLFQTRLAPTATLSNQKDPGKSKGKKKTKKKTNKTTIHEFENNTRYPSFVKDLSHADEAQAVLESRELKAAHSEPAGAVEPVRKARQNPKTSSKSANAKKRAANRGSKVTTEEEMDIDEPSMCSRPAAKKDPDAAFEPNVQEPPPGAPPAVEVTQSSPTTAEPHPLETLFKRPKPPSNNPTGANKQDLEVKIPFSFFGNEATDEEIEKSLETPGLPRTKRGKASGLPNLSIPITPYTQKDMQWRSQRSAAPTPDTAAPGRAGFGDFWNRFNEDREDDIEEEDEENIDDPNGTGPVLNPEQSVKDGAQKPSEDESEFTKWFWKNRGDNNRAWKKKRREAAKEQRKRDNKRRKRAI